MRKIRILPIVALLLISIPIISTVGQEQPPPPSAPRQANATVITVTGMIDEGLYQSIRRRTETALEAGADYIIYDIDTYGGRVDSADSIGTYLILEVSPRARTVAYVSRKAISAGALIGVSCNDIIMLAGTTIGDSAPVSFSGDKIEGVEREKAETYIRTVFRRAAEANDYPAALLEAMVTMSIEVFRIQNLQTGEYEFFQRSDLPTDKEVWDIDKPRLVVSSEQLLTLTASQALEYDIARAVVRSRQDAFDFLAERDNVVFGEVPVLLTTWSEEMVRWLNSPEVVGILFMIGLLGIYIEFNTPGLGLPGLVAAIAFTVLFGSKYLIGLAGNLEIAIFVIGLILLAVEIFVLPGFGIAGILGLLCIVYALFAMFIPGRPGEIPWPRFDFERELLIEGLMAMAAGFIGFLIIAWLANKYLPRTKALAGLILHAPVLAPDAGASVSMTFPPDQFEGVQPGDTGEALTLLRPAGKARFGSAVVDVVAHGEYIEKGSAVRIIEIHGNRVVVRAWKESGKD